MDKARIPQEILDHVVDYFHDDRHTLKNLALVSRKWLPAARTHLFHRISLEPPKASPAPSFLFYRSRGTPCQRLHHIISHQQSQLPYPGNDNIGGIVPYIRELSICEGMVRQEWIAAETTLPRLLGMMDNIRRFEISRSASMRIIWRQLPMEVLDVLGGRILNLPCLTELVLHGLILPSAGEFKNLIGRCIGLRRLEVEHVGFENEVSKIHGISGVGGLKLGRGTPLDTLVVGPRTSISVLSSLLEGDSPIDVSTIRKLGLSVSGGFPCFAELLRKANSVEVLELNLMNDIDLEGYLRLPLVDRLNLSDAPFLAELKISIDTIQKQADPLPWIGDVLKTANTTPPSPNRIRSIWIVYSLYLPAPYMDRSINTTIFEAWTDIDGILSGFVDAPGELAHRRVHRYAYLKSVRLDFMLENPIGFGVAPRFLKEVVLQSPGLERMVIFSVDAFDTSR